MEHFVTIFNKNYLPQGLCLYDSLKKNYTNFTLWVISLDDQTNDVLKNLKKKNLKILSTNVFETQELKRIKQERKRIFETKLRLKMYHIQRKTASNMTIQHVYSDLAPTCHKKSEIG